MNLLSFLEGSTPDNRGRSIDEILDLTDDAWERTHDFIQWLFPLNERSHANREAPTLSDPEMKAIAKSKMAQAGLKKGVNRYKEFLSSTTKWRSGYDHNHLRISRVIKSLRLLINDEAANGFKHWVAGELGDSIDAINKESKKYWRVC